MSASKGLFLQNIIAIIWDFDKTLSPHFMQRPIFQEYGIDEDEFWKEVNALPAYYQRAGVEIQPDTSYLVHLLSYVKAGRMPGLTNAKLEELGGRIKLFPGLPVFFGRLSGVLDAPEFKQGDLRLEHYVVSTGLEAMIRGSAIAPHVNGVWASAFIEQAAAPGFDPNDTPGSGVIAHIAGFLDNTTKTRAVFEINKGVNASNAVSVNDSIAEEDRRVPFRNMIYVADGPSDVPSFSVMRKHGGLAYAVYDPDSDAHFRQAEGLQKSQRVDAFGPADYREGSHTDKWFRLQLRHIAQRIIDDRRRATEGRITKGPVHRPED